ncbi:MAG: PhzF family phenazine biosynthesis protein [Geminicoccaceae bacterium]
MRSYRFVTADVFTDRRFGGNQLAVVLDARGLSDAEMQSIADEFGYSETTFVLPSTRDDADRQVRIFTPADELPFAGHPTLGTAHALAALGYHAIGEKGGAVRFEQRAGIVPVKIEAENGMPVRTELTAPGALEVGETVLVERVASVVKLEPAAIDVGAHEPRMVSLTNRFAIARLRNVDALAAAQPFGAAEAASFKTGLYLYAPLGENRWRCRLFAPLLGIEEDPATGSAAVTLAAYLAQLDDRSGGDFSYLFEQGVEMGRPSRLDGTAVKRDGRVIESRVAGQSVLVTDGKLVLD